MRQTVTVWLYIILIFIVILAGMTSCEDKLYFGDVDCSECYGIKPDSADLVVNLTMDDYYVQGVPLTFYRGDIEGGQIEYIDTAYASPYYLWVAVDRDYSVRAEYFRNNATVYVVDGTNIEIRKVPDACDVQCYVIKKARIDLSLNASYP